MPGRATERCERDLLRLVSGVSNSKETRGRCNDSAKRHLLIGYGADLTPVVAAKEAGASWNTRGTAETVWKLECAVDFPVGRNTTARRQGGHRKDGRTHRRTRTAEIKWYWAKERRTSRLSAWRSHERFRVFGERGCRPGAGRRPGTGYRPESGSWSAPPGR